MGKEPQQLTVKDLKTNPGKRINQAQRATFLKLIDDEFENQEAIFSKDYEAKKVETVAAYRKQHNLDKKVEEHAELSIRIKGIEAHLSSFGISPTGDIKGYYGDPESPHVQKLDIALKNLKETYSIPRTNKNKYKAHMNMAETYADALIILQEIMGNGILPRITELPKLLEQ